MRRLLIWGLLMTLVLGSVPAIFAQENTLSEEEQVIFDRLIASVTVAETYKSTLFTIEESDSYFASVIIPDERPYSRLQERTLTASGWDVKDGASEGSQRVFSGSYSYTENDGVLMSFVIEGEYRRIEDVRYINAHYLSSEGDVMPLPEGWLVGDEVVNHDALATLLQIDETEEESTYSQSLIEMTPFISTITSEEIVLDTGETAEQITVTVDPDKLGDYLLSGTESGETSEWALYQNNLSDTSGLVITFLLNAEGMLIGTTYTLAIHVSEMDLHAYDPDQFAEGTTVTLEYEQHSMNTASEINEPQDMPVVPEGVTVP